MSASCSTADSRIWVTFDFMQGPAVVGIERLHPVAAPATSPHAARGGARSNARFIPVTPTRVIDTRFSTGTVDPNEVLVLQLAANGFVARARPRVCEHHRHRHQTDGFSPPTRAVGRNRLRASTTTPATPCPTSSPWPSARGGTVCVVVEHAGHVIADLAGWYGSTGLRYSALDSEAVARQPGKRQDNELRGVASPVGQRRRRRRHREHDRRRSTGTDS